MTPTNTKETWADRFDKEFKRETVFTALNNDYNLRATGSIAQIKAFISQELSRLEEEKDREWIEFIRAFKEMDYDMIDSRIDALITNRINQKASSLSPLT